MISDFRADLHCHSTCSDGSFTPEQLVKHAVDLKLSGLSITDHDTVEAYHTAMPLAKELGLELISGIEFSSVHKGVSVHILAYAFNLENGDIAALCEAHKLRRKERNLEILDKLSKNHMPVREEELIEATSMSLFHTSIGRPHIALAMIKKGYVDSVNEAFKNYIGDGRSCYASGKSFSSEETLQIIHQAKGLAVIAHPHLVHEQNILKDLFEMKFDGLECYYGTFGPQKHQRWLKKASQLKWLVTGGSDFHGTIKPNIPLGSSWVSEEPFRIMQQHYINNT